MRDRILTGLALLLLCAWSITRVVRPPRPVPATASDTVFSAERAMRHVAEIAIRPHAMGMPDHERVRDYVASQLMALGIHVQFQTTTGVGTLYQVAGRVQNVMGWLSGSDPKGRAVLLVAHYDGVEAGPAAGDNGSGTAVLLETMRALRARPKPLANDVIALVTDGEETGLLGAAAFVREHPWAKDVSAIVNVDARGTSGRAFMFQTGAGNRDAVSLLRAVGNASAGSVFTTIYRTLPNDTDLSELLALGQPALNFAIVHGVERYHTSHDNFAHLSAASVQHEGDQVLGLAQAFGSGPLPRPRSGDAVFFDMPAVGLVIYPEKWSIPLAILSCILVGAAVLRSGKGAAAGVAVTITAVVVGGVVAWLLAAIIGALQSRLPWGGDPRWVGTSATTVSLAALAVTLAVVSSTRKWAFESGARFGAMILWALLGLAISIKAPGASYLFTWPALLAGIAALVPTWTRAAQWVALGITLLLLVGFVYGVAVLMVGVSGGGAVVLGAFTVLIGLLALPQLELIASGVKWLGANWVARAAVISFVAGAFTTRWSAARPVPTALAYVENADSTDAWFGTFGGFTDTWTSRVIGHVAPAPGWTTRITGPRGFVGHAVQRMTLDAPSATLVGDTLLGAARRVVLRVHAPPGTTSLVMRAVGVPVLSSSIDGRVVDTTHYRRHLAEWTMPYWAMPDTGAIVALSVPPGSHFGFELIARRPGLPAVPSLSVPPRPPRVAAFQTGDASYVYRKLTF
jgi:hypothetical protein